MVPSDVIFQYLSLEPESSHPYFLQTSTVKYDPSRRNQIESKVKLDYALRHLYFGIHLVDKHYRVRRHTKYVLNTPINLGRFVLGAEESALAVRRLRSLWRRWGTGFQIVWIPYLISVPMSTIDGNVEFVHSQYSCILVNSVFVSHTIFNYLV